MALRKVFSFSLLVLLTTVGCTDRKTEVDPAGGQPNAAKVETPDQKPSTPKVEPTQNPAREPSGASVNVSKAGASNLSDLKDAIDDYMSAFQALETQVPRANSEQGEQQKARLQLNTEIEEGMRKDLLKIESFKEAQTHIKRGRQISDVVKASLRMNNLDGDYREITFVP